MQFTITISIECIVNKEPSKEDVIDWVHELNKQAQKVICPANGTKMHVQVDLRKEK